MRAIVSATVALLVTGVVALACSSSSSDAPGSDPSDEAGTGGGSGGEGGAGACSDGKKDGTETDVDCGGSCSAKCTVLEGCAAAADCAKDLLCLKNVCASAKANDGTKDGDETDVDCGGTGAPPCVDGKKCAAGPDCVDKVCIAGSCAPPTPTDGQKNGTETDVDCGGMGAPACADGKMCKVAIDCTSDVCTGGVCVAASTMDGVKNGTETDVDCGGGDPAPACADSKGCKVGPDCKSLVCTGGVCQVPTGTDGQQNGDESDVDCGGTTTGAPKCAATKSCTKHADCLSDGCDYNKKCAINPSCTQQNGGATCGVGESATDSCCAQATLTGSTTTIDKFHVTAGRMRAFIERVNGDVRTFAKTTAGWNDAAYSPLVSSNIAEANIILGPTWNNAPNDADYNPTNDATLNSKRSCLAGSFGGHTYYTPPGGGETEIFTAAQLDPKALNCVGWHMARAFCSWDHGRLPTQAELTNAFKNNGTTSFPWQSAAFPAWNQNAQDANVNHQFIYNYPGNPKYAKDGTTIFDVSWFVSPPGRFPGGANQNGAMDMAGNLLHWMADAEYKFMWTGSWERHDGFLEVQSWKSDWPGEPNGYYGIGFRCVHD